MFSKLRSERQDRIPEGSLEGFPYVEVRRQERTSSAATRWPLLAAVDKRMRSIAQARAEADARRARLSDSGTNDETPAPARHRR